MIEKSRIAVLITCYNRVEQTLLCLTDFYNAVEKLEIDFIIFLVDDNSPDLTGAIVRDKFPEIIVIQGTGHLYWNQGMRLAWMHAAKHSKFDYFLWLNDDTRLFKDGLKVLFNDLNAINHHGIIAGICVDPYTNKITYGGRSFSDMLKPNGSPQSCRYINGNVVLIPDCVFKVVGINSPDFLHSYGDYDYGLEVKKKGFDCCVSSKIVAYCEKNKKLKWNSSELSFTERVKRLSQSSKTGFNLTEHILFVRKHQIRTNIILIYLHIYLNLLSPRLYKKVKVLVAKIVTYSFPKMN